MSKLLLLFVFLLIAINLNAVTKTSSPATGSGNWSTPATWSPVGVPISTDTVIIASHNIITVDTSCTCAALIMQGPSFVNGLAIVNSYILTVTGAIIMNIPVNSVIVSYINIGAGTLNAASITIPGSPSPSTYCQILGTTGTINVTGNITFTGTAAQARIIMGTGSTINIGGTLGSGGTLSDSGTVNFNGSSPQLIPPYLYSTLKANNSTGVSLTAATSISSLIIGDFTPNSIFNDAGFAIAVHSTLNISATGSYYCTQNQIDAWTTVTAAVGSTVYYSLTGDQTIRSLTYKNVTTSGSGTKSGAANLAIGGNLKIGDGTTFATPSSQNFLVSGTTTVGTGTSGILLLGGTKQTYTGLLTINAGGTWDNSANNSVTFGGGIANNGTFTAGTGIQTFNKTAALTGIFSIPSVTISGSGAVALTNNGTLTITTALNGSDELINAGTGILNLNFTAVPGITTLTATAVGNIVNYGLSGAQTIKGTTYYNLKLSGTGTKTLGPGTTTIPVNGYFELSGGAPPPTFALGGNTFTVTSGASLIYSASGAQTVNTAAEWNSNIYNLTINNPAGVTLGSARTLNGNLTLTSGTFTNGSNLTLGITANIFRSGGSLASAPTFLGTVSIYYEENGTLITTGPEIPPILGGLYSVNVLSINTSHGVLLNAPIIANNFYLYSGIIKTSSANLLTLAETYSYSAGADSLSFVDGPMAYRISSGSVYFNFPIGKDGVYRPILFSVTHPDFSSSIITAEMFNSAPPSNSLPGTLTSVASERYYKISQANGTFSAAYVSLQYGYDDSISSAANVRIVQGPAAGGGTWVDLGGVGSGVPTGSISSTTNFTNISNNSIFALGNSNTLYQLNLTAFIQGFYDGSMTADTVTVELHNTSSPYSLVESKKGLLNTSGNGTFNFISASNGTPYYIVIKHRNAVETWSAAGNVFSNYVLNYDFTTASSKAYGNNLISKDSKYCLYNGDVNQDGIVDSGDLGTVDNDNANYAAGYLNTDVNGDGIIDSGDLGLVDNNNANYVGKIVPSGAIVTRKITRNVNIRNKNIK